jgi:GTPase SAR1 family protein/predicted nucleic acid binding AN1-type Zn finger protein
MTNYARSYRFRGDYYDRQSSQKIDKFKFFNFPLNDVSIELNPKRVDSSLARILSNPQKHNQLQVSNGRIDKTFIGLSSPQPNSEIRFPFWLSSEMINNHVLIAGQVGSGKTSLLYRIIAGALNTHGTVIIGELKSGNQGYAEGAAFTNLSVFLEQQLDINTYRWPRGNCWFNPLKYLTDLESRKIFLRGICDSIPLGTQGDLKAFLVTVADIANLLIEYLYSVDLESGTNLNDLKNIVYLLKHPEEVKEIIEVRINSLKEIENGKSCNESTKVFCQKQIQKYTKIIHELNRMNFFALGTSNGKKDFIATSTALRFFISAIEYNDLLYYTSSHEKGKDGQTLVELTLDNILYDRSLVVISQPADHPSSSMIGNLFWDSLLDRVISLGLHPQLKNGKSRQKVAVILDETQRLPVGRLGNAGDYLRQFNLGLIEVFPSIKDRARWDEQKNVYRTVISLSQGIPDVVRLIYGYLTQKQPDLIQPGFQSGNDGLLKAVPIINNDYHNLNQDNPGISERSLNHTGEYTALLWSNVTGGSSTFWIDLESPLLSHIDYLIQDALTGDLSSIKVAKYALGLILEC